jgi:hypothetical protein
VLIYPGLIREIKGKLKKTFGQRFLPFLWITLSRLVKNGAERKTY